MTDSLPSSGNAVNSGVARKKGRYAQRAVIGVELNSSQQHTCRGRGGGAMPFLSQSSSPHLHCNWCLEQFRIFHPADVLQFGVTFFPKGCLRL